MDVSSNGAPIIIKRKKVVKGDGHHGGAWKVAYADFVTAMMAFFMMMWLLNAATDTQREGIADYFTPSVSFSKVSGGGEGAFGGDSVFSENTLARNGTGATMERPTDANAARGEAGEDTELQDEVFVEMEQALMGRGGESTEMENILRHVTTRITDEGLVIELHDMVTMPLFEEDSATPTQLLRDLALVISEETEAVPNPMAVEAHVAAEPVVVARPAVWELSTARANAMRELLVGTGTEETRIQRMTGHADREPIYENRMALRNNRLEIILLRDVPAEE